MSHDLANLLEQVKVHGYIKLESVDSNQRKLIHEYCELQPNLTHISYYDEKFEHIFKTKYWCSLCKNWKLDENSKEIKMRYCCENANGSQGCPDWDILCVQCGTIIWNQDAHDDSNYKRKQSRFNNAMLIFYGDVYLEQNKQLIKSIGMRMRTVNKKNKKSFKK